MAIRLSFGAVFVIALCRGERIATTVCALSRNDNRRGVCGGFCTLRVVTVRPYGCGALNGTPPSRTHPVIARSKATWQSAFPLGLLLVVALCRGVRIATPVCELVRNDKNGGVAAVVASCVSSR